MLTCLLQLEARQQGGQTVYVTTVQYVTTTVVTSYPVTVTSVATRTVTYTSSITVTATSITRLPGKQTSSAQALYANVDQTSLRP